MKRIILLLLVMASTAVFAQEKATVKLGTPNETMFTHLHFLQSDTYKPASAARALWPTYSKAERKKKAIQLKQIFDGEGLFVQFYKIPDVANHIDSSSKKTVFAPFPYDLPNVYLMKRGNSWYYSKETMEAIPKIHQRIYPLGTDFFMNLFPAIGDTQFLGIKVWQVLGFSLILLGALILHFLLRNILNPVVSFFTKTKLYPSLASVKDIHLIASYLSVLAVIWLIKGLFPSLMLKVGVTEFVVFVVKVLSTIFIVLILLKIIKIFVEYLKKHSQKTTNKMDEQLVPIANKAMQIVVVLGGAFQIMGYLNINVTALIAGLSIGGLALALAAQDTVKQFIGSVMIFVDQPFQIGDFIDNGSVQGTVEEVGFRTTRLRLSDSSLVAIPNGTVANQAITNKGRRVFRLFETQLGVVYQTPLDKLEAFIAGLKDIAAQHNMVDDEAQYIHLLNLGASSIDILFRVRIMTKEFGQELEVKEEILFQILKMAEEMGVSFAYPTTSVFIEKDEDFKAN